jgi:hypothetical protein
MQAKFCTIGKGRPTRLTGMLNNIETLPFTLKAGTVTFARRFGWDIRSHLIALSSLQLEFWKSLSSCKKGLKRIKYSPRDLASAVKQYEIFDICKWKGCLELKKFVVRAIHDVSVGYVPIPYHLVFF